MNLTHPFDRRSKEGQKPVMKRSVLVILLCTLALLGFGMAMLYSASFPTAQRSPHYNSSAEWFIQRQLIWAAIGLVLMLVTAKLDYIVWRKLVWPIFILSFVSLLLVFAPGVGVQINKEHRWLHIGPVTLQPSEFAKLAVVMFLAYYLEHWERDLGAILFKNVIRLKQNLSMFIRGFVWPLLATGAIALPILFEIDVGTSVLVGTIGLCVMVVGGVRWWLLLATYAPAAGCVFYYIWQNPRRREQFFVFLDPEKYKGGAGLQQWQAILAFVRGGWSGVGFAKSMAKERWLPYSFSDFIAPVIGEELGLAGMLVLILLYMTLVGAGIYVASRARERFGHLLGWGITAMIGLQAILNLLVVTSQAPNKGLTLPFISYGGSSLCVMLASAGILMNIAARGGSQADIWPRRQGQLFSGL